MNKKIRFILSLIITFSVSINGLEEWSQTDWSGGSGQSSWSTIDRYLSDDSKLETNNPSGDVTINVPINTGNGNDGSLVVSPSSGKDYTFTSSSNYTLSSEGTTEINSGSAKLKSLTAPISTDLKLWLCVDSINGASDNDAISSWSDLSGSANDATQITPANQPTYKINVINGKPILRFDGSASYMSLANTPFSGAEERTVFIISKANVITTQSCVMIVGDVSGTSGYSFAMTPEVAVRVSGNKVFNQTAGTTDFKLMTFRFDGTNVTDVEAWLDGTLLGEASSSGAVINTSTNAAIIGANFNWSPGYFDGDIAEIVVYDRALSEAEREEMELYLGNKYGIHNEYAIDNPTIIPKYEYPFSSAITSFTETATKTNSAIQYNVSSDNGNTWKYWNGSAWVVANGSYSETNAATIVNANIADLETSGMFLFKAFLHSNDGNNTPELENIFIQSGAVSVNDYTYLTDIVINAGTTNLNVNNGSEFSNGDEILIIQMQHVANYGTFEFATISSGGGTDFLTINSPITNTYYSNTFNQANASATQIVRVPNFIDVTVENTSEITCPAWNGYTGGILFFRASGDVVINVGGKINVASKGFRGGDHGGTDGYKGESYLGGNSTAIIGGYNLGCANDGRQPNGGGGGVYVNGAGGSYGSLGTDGEIYTSSSCLPLAGILYGISDLSKINLGSGGGGGHPNSDAHPHGGRGGGIVWMSVKSLSVNGTINANGEDAYVDPTQGQWGAGGGSGGSIFMTAKNFILGTSLVTSRGGAALDGLQTLGHGGDGGNGRIRIEYGTISGTTSPAASSQILSLNTIATLTSSIYDMGTNVSGPYFSNWSETLNGESLNIRVRTDVNSNMSTATDFSSANNISNAASLTSINSINANQRYVQYQVLLNSSDGLSVPYLQDINIEFNHKPNVFDIATPIDNIELSTLLPTFDWEDSYDSNSASGDVFNYTLEIDDNSDFSSPTFTKTTSVSNYTLIGGEELTDNTHYYWRVKAKDNYPDSIFSTSNFELFTDNNGNETPTLCTPLGPLNNSEIKPTEYITWTRNDNDPGDVLTYTIQIDDDPAFGSPEIVENGITGTSKVLNTFTDYVNLVDNRIYYWIIQSKDPDHLVSGYTVLGSQYFFFNKNNNAPFICENLNISNGNEVFDGDFLRWDEFDPDSLGLNADTVKATLEISSNSAFSIIVSTTTGIVADSIQINNLTNYATLADNTNYWWRLTSIDNHTIVGPTTDGSAKFYLNKVNDTPLLAVLINPDIDDTLKTGDTLIWNASVDPDSLSNLEYQILIRREIDDLNFYYSSWVTDTFLALVDLPRFDSLQSGDSLYWYIKARDQHNASTSWSGGTNQDFIFISTPASAPTSLDPNSGEFAYPTTVLAWIASSDVDAGLEDSLLYIVEIDTFSNFSNIISKTESINLNSITLSSVTDYGNLPEDKTYYWRVYSIDNHGTYSDTSVTESFVFTTTNDPPAVPTNLAPNLGTQTSANGDLTWNTMIDPETDAVHYQFQMATDAGFTSIIQNDSGITDTIRTIKLLSSYPILQQGITYYWRVRSIDENSAASNYATTNAIVFVSTKPTIVTSLNPVDGNEVSPIDSIKWTVGIDSDTLDIFTVVLELDDNSDFSSINLLESNIDASAKGVILSNLSSYSNLVDNTIYYWRVYEIDNHGKSSDTSSGVDSIYFNKLNNNPLDVVLTWPNTEEIVSGIDTLKWGSTTDPDNNDTVNYVVEITNGTFTFPSAIDTLSDTIVKISELTNFATLEDNTFYCWRIVSIDNHGLLGLASDTGKFYLNLANDIPNVATIINPLEAGKINPSENFIWEASDPDSGDIVHYELQVAHKNTFTNIIFEILETDNILDTFKLLGGFTGYHDSLKRDSTYYWRVKVYDDNATSSAYGTAKSFVYNPAYAELKIGTSNPDTGASAVPATDLTLVSTLIKANGWENINIKKIIYTASGTANESSDLANVLLYLDNNMDGLKDAGDTYLDIAFYGADNGTISFDISQTIIAGDSVQLLLIYNLNDQATDGEVFSAEIASFTDIILVGVNSSDTLDVDGVLPKGHINITTPSTFEINTENSNNEIAGTPFSLTITTRDGAGAIASTYNGTHTVNFTWDATDSPKGNLPIKPVSELLTFTNGIATTSKSFELVKSGDVFTLDILEISGPAGSTDSITVSVGAIENIKIRTAASNAGRELVDTIITSDDSLTVYSSSYDSLENFVDNPTVSWGGTSIITDIINVSDTFTILNAIELGSGKITANYSGAAFDSTGLITVNSGNISYIKIMDSSNGNGNEFSTISITSVDTLSLYAASFDADSNYIRDTSVNWFATDSLATWLSETTGDSIMLIPENSGVGKIIADFSGANNDTTEIINISANISFIKVVDARGVGANIIDTLNVDADTIITLYAAGYDNNNQFIANVNILWESNGIVSGNLNTSSFSDSVIFSPVDSGAFSQIIANHLSFTDDSIVVNVMPGELSFVLIKDSVNNGGNLLSNRTLSTIDTLRIYSAGFDSDSNYISDTSVTWFASGDISTWLSTTTGNSTNLIPENTGSGTITASHVSADNYTTGTITITVSISGIKIRNARAGLGQEIDSLIMNSDSNYVLYAAGYDALNQFISDVSVSWLAEEKAVSTLNSIVNDSVIFNPAKIGNGLIIADHSNAPNDTVYTQTDIGNLALIIIRDSANGLGNEINFKNILSVDSLSLYSAAYDADSNYLADTIVNWYATGDLSTWLSASSGEMITLIPQDSGVGTIIADHNLAINDTTGVISVTANISYVKITDGRMGLGNIIDTLEINADSSITLFAAGYDANGHYISDESVLWEGVGISDLDLNLLYGDSVIFKPSKVNSEINLIANHTSVNNDTIGIKITVGALEYIVIRDSANGLGSEINSELLNSVDTLTMYVASYDLDSNYISDTLAIWSLGFGLSGTITTDTSSVAKFIPIGSGGGKILAEYASDSSKKDSTGAISIIADLSYIKIRTERDGNGLELADTNITSDDSLKLYAAAYNADSVYIKDVKVFWGSNGVLSDYSKLPADSLVINADLFGTSRIFIYSIYTGSDTSGIITIDPGLPVSIKIYSNDSLNVTTDNTIQFIADVKDADSNIINNAIVNFALLDSIGFLDASTGLFYADSIDSGQIIAEISGIIDTSNTITIIGGALADIVISPDSAVISADSTLLFSAIGYDANNNIVNIPNKEWSLSDTTKGTISGGLYYPNKFGTIKVILKSASIIDSIKELTITTGELASILIVDSSTADGLEIKDYYFAINDTSVFYCAGYDQFKNFIGLQTASWTGNGNIDAAIITGDDNALSLWSTETAKGKIFANVGIFSDSTDSIEIVAGNPAFLTITSNNDTISADSTIQFMVEAYTIDTLEASAGNITWSVIGNIGSINNVGIFTPVKAGIGFITATSNLGGIVDTSDTIMVVPGDLESIILSPYTVEIVIDSNVQLSYKGFDSDSNEIILNSIATYSISNNIGNVNISGLFTPNKPDTGGLYAEIGGIISNEISIKVKPGELENIQIRDGASGTGDLISNNHIIALNDTLSLYAAAYDIYGNYISDTSVTWLYSGILMGKSDTNTGSMINILPDLAGNNGSVTAIPTSGNSYTITGINVIDRNLDHLEISPSISGLTTDDEIQFEIIGKDTLGAITNSGTIVWSLIGSNSIGTLSKTGLFIPRKPGKVIVKAVSSLNDSISSDTIMITKGVLERIDFGLVNKNITCDDNLVFNFVGYDLDTNIIDLRDSILLWEMNDSSLGLLDSTGDFEAIHPGTLIVSLNVGGVTKVSDTVIIKSGILDSLGLTFANTNYTDTIPVDSKLLLDIYGMDKDLNRLDSLAESYVLLNNNGNIDSLLYYTPSVADTASIVCWYGELNTKLAITITPGTPVRIEIIPDSAISLPINDSISFTFNLFDIKQNLVSPESLLTVIVIPEDRGTIDSNGIFRSKTTGKFVISASYDTLNFYTDTMNVYSADIMAEGGEVEVIEGVIIDFPPAPQNFKFSIDLIDSMSKYKNLDGFRQISPVYDFSNSSKLGFDSSMTMKFKLDSLDKDANDIGDYSNVKIFKFIEKDRTWEIVKGSLIEEDDLGNKLIVLSDTLYTLVVGIDTVEPILEHIESNSIVSYDDVFTIKGNMKDNIANAELTIYYRNGGSVKYDTAIITIDKNGDFNRELLSYLMSEKGFEYYIQTDDGTMVSNTKRMNVNIGVGEDDLISTDLRENMWSLVSFPIVAINDSINSIFADFGKYKYDWHLYKWNDSNFISMNDTTLPRVKTGEAYWLYTKQGASRIALDSGTTVSINKLFEIELKPNVWTAVGVPFNFDISKQAIVDSTKESSMIIGPFEYDSSRWIKPEDITELKKWKGYYYKNTTDSIVKLKIPAFSNSAYSNIKSKISKNNQDDVKLKMSIESDTEIKSISLGFLKGRSSKEYDHNIDCPEPPAFTKDNVGMFIQRNEFKDGFKKLMSDYSDLSSGGESWKIKLNSLELDKTYTIKIKGTESLSENLELYIVDPLRKIKMNLRTKGDFKLNSEKANRELIVISGSKEYVESKTKDIKEVPTDFNLAANYPNPFNPITNIAYAIPEMNNRNSRVVISIFDMRGKLIKTLINENKESGYYKVKWNGKTNSGISVASGIYLYRIKVGNIFTKTRKMIMVK